MSDSITQTDRDGILKAIGEHSGSARPPIQISQPPKRGREDLWAEFFQRLGLLGGQEADRATLDQLLSRPLYADDDACKLLKIRSNADIWEAEVGITLADLAVAETGSLLISAGEGRARLASLAPIIHVAMVRRQDIVGTLGEAIDRFSHRTSVLVTGSSRTADIEGVLVRGVHGPGQLYVLVYEEIVQG